MELEKLAQSAGISLPELAFRYVLSSEMITLCGTARREELHAAIEYSNRGPLDADLIAKIRRVDVADKRLLNPGHWPIP
jgi:aryl-alcohol dehydrogenase-like predicted oxidoreductase